MPTTLNDNDEIPTVEVPSRKMPSVNHVLGNSN
jgi:hypothetical protein